MTDLMGNQHEQTPTYSFRGRFAGFVGQPNRGISHNGNQYCSFVISVQVAKESFMFFQIFGEERLERVEKLKKGQILNGEFRIQQNISSGQGNDRVFTNLSAVKLNAEETEEERKEREEIIRKAAASAKDLPKTPPDTPVDKEAVKRQTEPLRAQLQTEEELKKLEKDLPF